MKKTIDMQFLNTLKIKFVSNFQSFHPRTLLFWIHTIVSLLMIWSLLNAFFILSKAEIDFEGNKYFKHGYENKQFLLSIWVMAFQVIYFGSYTIIDLIAVWYGKESVKASRMRKTLYDISSYILFTIVFPLSTVIFLFFWALYYWHSEYMYPKLIDNLFPRYMNHMIHTMPVPACIVYMFTEVKNEPPKSKTLPGLITFLTLYTIILVEIRRCKGLWVYPVLNILTSSQVLVLLITFVIASFVSYFFGYYLNNIMKDLRSNILVRMKKTKLI